MSRTDFTRLQRCLGIGLFFCLVMSGAGTLHASQELKRAWYARYPFPAGGSVSVENVQGEISVEGWDRRRSKSPAKIGKRQRPPGRRASGDESVEQLETFRTVYPPPLINRFG